MADNMRIWDAVSKTDPNHTKAVEFGRKFTSIDAHWQIMQATKQFGPVGQGWGYSVEHSTITLTPEIILAVADVMLWWNGEDPGKTAQYGPIRATCEMYSPKTYKGKRVPGEFVTDEDAPKKAMTDALTKGLSHLGFSADVFLGLFDDNRYVQKMRQEFAAGPVDIHGHPHKAAAMEAEQFSKSPDVIEGFKRWVADQKLALANMSTQEEVKQWSKTNDKNVKKLFKEDEPLWQDLKDAYDLALDRTRARAA